MYPAEKLITVKKQSKKVKKFYTQTKRIIKFLKSMEKPHYF